MDAPFFSRTIAAWRNGGAAAVRTDLSALAAFDRVPALDPDLIIAHPSRSGSTLLARLAAEGGSILVSEPLILQQLFGAHLAGRLDRPVAPLVRAVVRALGQHRHDGQRYVLKLNSQLARFLPDIRRAFPQVPIMWLQRLPAEVVASNLDRPAGAGPARPEELAAWVLRRVALAFLGATAFVDRNIHILDYRDLPETGWSAIAALLGIDPAVVTPARLRDIARRDARSGASYVPRDHRPLPPAVGTIVQATLDPLYAALGGRRAA
jgi:hypothetical protein